MSKFAFAAARDSLRLALERTLSRVLRADAGAAVEMVAGLVAWVADVDAGGEGGGAKDGGPLSSSARSSHWPASMSWAAVRTEVAMQNVGAWISEKTRPERVCKKSAQEHRAVDGTHLVKTIVATFDILPGATCRNSVRVAHKWHEWHQAKKDKIERTSNRKRRTGATSSGHGSQRHRLERNERANATRRSPAGVPQRHRGQKRKIRLKKERLTR